MSEVTIRRVLESERDIFKAYFQEYLCELASLNDVRPNEEGVFEYGLLERYWVDERYKAFFIGCAEGREEELAGLVLLRELSKDESSCGRETLQVAEVCVFKAYRRRGIGRAVIRLAAQMALARRMPLTWSAYMNNRPANALYRSILREFRGKGGLWIAESATGIDQSGLARFYYRMTPVGAET